MKKLSTLFLFNLHKALFRLGLHAPFIDFLSRKYNYLSNIYGADEIDSELDKIYSQISHKLKRLEAFESKNKATFIATEFYESGGHTEWQKRIVHYFSKQFEQSLIITNGNLRRGKIEKSIPKKISELSRICDLISIESERNFIKKINIIIESYNENPSSFIICNHHPNDVITTLFIKHCKENDIKIIFFNHADHINNLGHNFADVILCFRPLPTNISKKNINKIKLLNIIVNFSEEDLESLKGRVKNKKQIYLKHKIPNDSILGFSGGNPVKFFNNGKSEFFENLIDIISDCKNYYHFVFADFSEEKLSQIGNIFANSSSDIKERLIILPADNSYIYNMSISDIFLDSYPTNGITIYAEACYFSLAAPVWINSSELVKSYEYTFPVENIFATKDEYKKILIEIINNSDSLKEYQAISKEYFNQKYTEASFMKDFNKILSS